MMIIAFIVIIILPQNNDKHVNQYFVAFPLVLCGFAYCFYVSGLWPSIPYVLLFHDLVMSSIRKTLEVPTESLLQFKTVD